MHTECAQAILSSDVTSAHNADGHDSCRNETIDGVRVETSQARGHQRGARLARGSDR